MTACLPTAIFTPAEIAIYADANTAALVTAAMSSRRIAAHARNVSARKFAMRRAIALETLAKSRS
jgi:hypothetical protein